MVDLQPKHSLENVFNVMRQEMFQDVSVKVISIFVAQAEQKIKDSNGQFKNIPLFIARREFLAWNQQ